MQILLVENEKLTLEGIHKTVDWKEIGIEKVYLAINGVEGLALAKTHRPEVILTDIKMPRLDGIEMARCIREFSPESSIVFMSAYTEKELLINAIAVSAFGWVEKPLNISNLTAMIQNAVMYQNNRIQQKANIDDLRDNYAESLSVIWSICQGDAMLENSIPPKLRKQFDRKEQHQLHPIIQSLCGHLAEHYSDPDICLQSMADLLNVSVPHLCAMMKSELNCTFVEFLTNIRIESAKRLMLRANGMRVRDIAEMVGYRDANYFIKVFKKKVGKSPAEYRESIE